MLKWHIKIVKMGNQILEFTSAWMVTADSDFWKTSRAKTCQWKKNSKMLTVKLTVKVFFHINKTKFCATYRSLGRSNRNAPLKCQSCLYTILCGICCLYIVYTLVTHIACKWTTWNWCHWSYHMDIPIGEVWVTFHPVQWDLFWVLTSHSLNKT